MKADDIIPVALIFIIVGAMMGIGFHLGYKQAQADSVKAGVGEFVISDPVNGSTQFQWKTHEQP